MLDSEKLITLYECFVEARETHFLCDEDVKNIFYCGRRYKWNLPNTLLIIVDDKRVKGNLYYEDFASISGNSSSNFLSQHIIPNIGPWSPPNKPYTFHSTIVTDNIFEENPAENIIGDIYEYYTKETIIDIGDDMRRLYKLRSFI